MTWSTLPNDIILMAANHVRSSVASGRLRLRSRSYVPWPPNPSRKLGTGRARRDPAGTGRVTYVLRYKLLKAGAMYSRRVSTNCKHCVLFVLNARCVSSVPRCIFFLWCTQSHALFLVPSSQRRNHCRIRHLSNQPSQSFKPASTLPFRLVIPHTGP